MQGEVIHRSWVDFHICFTAISRDIVDKNGRKMLRIIWILGFFAASLLIADGYLTNFEVSFLY